MLPCQLPIVLLLLQACLLLLLQRPLRSLQPLRLRLLHRVAQTKQRLRLVGLQLLPRCVPLLLALPLVPLLHVLWHEPLRRHPLPFWPVLLLLLPLLPPLLLQLFFLQPLLICLPPLLLLLPPLLFLSASLL